MENTTTTLQVLGRRIHEIRGGRGRPVLYLHSAMGEAVWLPHLSALARRFELHAPAHPGFLTSEGIDEIRDIEDVVDHYHAYLDAMGWERVAVVGLSLGGWIAAELAARHPERISDLVLTSSVGIWVKEKPIADIFAVDTRFPERVKRLLFHDVECPAAKMLVSPADMELPDELLMNVMNAFAATAKIGWNPLLHDPRLERILPRVTARTLCLWGDDDHVVPLDYGEKFAKLIPGATLQVIRGAGHLLPLEQGDAWVAAVSEFLGA